MLVLSRMRDQAIVIGDDVEIRVIDIRGEKVRLGVTAPREVSVHRKEIYDAIRRENTAASQVTPEDVESIISPPISQSQSLQSPSSHSPPQQPPPPMRLVKENPLPIEVDA